MTLRELQANDWLTEDIKLTKKAEDVLEFMEDQYTVKKIKQKKAIMGEDFLSNVNAYRDLWPPIKLPSDVPARVNVKELEKKFTWFFNNYSFTWEVILEATRKYIQEKERENYRFMKNSGYFISKSDVNKNISSTLANYCDMIVDGGGIEEQTVNLKVR